MSSARTAGRRGASGHGPAPLGLEVPSIDDLVVEHSAAVFRLARSVVQDSALADDVTQETFIKVWKHLDTFRGGSSLRSWILRIAHNTAVSTLRTIRDSATDPVKLPHAADPIPTTRVVEGRLAADDLRDALEQLDDLTREIVVLREVEGMSYDEIAQTLDVPIPTVKTRLLRARRRLGVVLEEWRS
ncbi:MAG: RNA polymerase sigma factor [Ilumatobacter sp.]